MNSVIKVNVKKSIGYKQPVYIIAEMSANHGGNFDRAIEIIARANGKDNPRYPKGLF